MIVDELHPAADLLLAFGIGKLENDRAEKVQKHLERCADCRRLVAEMSADSFVGRLRKAVGSSDGTPQPQKSLSGLGRSISSRSLNREIPAELASSQQYTEVRELGQGGMGVVYLAKNKLMDRLEVLKVLNKTLLDRPGAAERFLREIRSAARLQHPNVVGAYSALQMGELLVFAMEYVEGDTLAELVRKHGPLPVANASYYAIQAAQGLQHAHEREMVHRDIKPSNLMLTKATGKSVVKVLDFGLAKATSEKGVDAALTGEGKMMGTPDFIAPEQTLDATKADIRADIYSLGCSLYFMLAAKPPFSGGSLYELLKHHHDTHATSLNLIRDDVPLTLAAIVSRMMAKDPRKRYQTPEEVAKALLPFIKARTKNHAQHPSFASSPQQSMILAEVNAAATPSLQASPTNARPTQINARSEVTDGQTQRTSSTLVSSQVAQSRKVHTLEPEPRRRWLRWIAVLTGAAIMLTLGLSGVFKVRTQHGTIIVENVPEDAEVVVDGERVTISRNGQVVTASAIAGGPHRLKVVQGGNDLWSSDVTVKLSGQPIRLRMEEIKKLDPLPPEIPQSKETKNERANEQKTEQPPIEDEAAGIAKLQALLLDHEWYYLDNLYPPGENFRFYTDGRFHYWRWKYWVVGPRSMRIHYDTKRNDGENGILFTFNEDLTEFSGEWNDPNGRHHKVTGKRQ